MTTLYLEWNSDFVLTPAGSLQLATGWDSVRQRIERRIITNPAQQLPSGISTPADYVFDSAYGVGAGSLVGQPYNQNFIASLRQKIQAGVLSDAAVDTSVPPSINVTTPQNDAVWAVVGVTLASGNVGTIALQVPVSG